MANAKTVAAGLMSLGYTIITGGTDCHIVHLDLKPNNVVCVSRDNNDQRVKIIDFGLARLVEDCGGLAMCGTLEFMSPEVLACRGATTASDIWSIGVIVFMMVTGGYSPFYSSKKYKMQRMILRGEMII